MATLKSRLTALLQRGWDLPETRREWAAWIAAVVGGSALIAVKDSVLVGAVFLLVGIALFAYRWRTERSNDNDGDDSASA